MTREEAKEMFRKDKDAYGKPRHIMKNIDKIYDDFEAELALNKAYDRKCKGNSAKITFDCPSCNKKTTITNHNKTMARCFYCGSKWAI